MTHTSISYDTTYSPGTHAPWEVEMSIETNDNRHVDTEEEFRTAKPGKIISITSKQNMEITITKTCLNVLTDLGKKRFKFFFII